MPDFEQIASCCADFPLGVVVVLLLLAQLYYILFVYGKLAGFRVKSFRRADRQPPASIIICARNERENLKTFLPVVLEQHYPNFEVIVVNDRSEDGTGRVLDDFASAHGDRLKVIDIEENAPRHGKKAALAQGINQARFGHLVFTDADCRPDSPNWLAEMAGAFADGNEIVLGYSPYFEGKGFLNHLIRFETTHTAMSYLSYALRHNAYMGVGRNLAYTKNLFFKGNGFARHLHITSGDDDLFVNQNASRTNVALSIHPDAHVYSGPKTTWKSYYRQKGRHAGASVLYKGRHKRMLAAQLLSALLFYACLPVCLLLFPEIWFVPVGAYLLRLGCQLFVFHPIYKKLRVSDLLPWLPLLDVCYYVYICTNGLLNRRKTETAW